MRTAPVELLTQAEMFVDTGAAMTAVLPRSETARTPTYLREDIQTSGDSGTTFRQGRMMCSERGNYQGAKWGPCWYLEAAGRGTRHMNSMN